MENRTKQILLATGFAIFIGFSIYLWWPQLGPKLAADNFDCVFDAKSTDNVALSGNPIKTIERITLKGYIDEPFQQNRYDFSGKAKIFAQGTVLEASTGGHIHFDQDGTPLGVHLKFEDERLGGDEIFVMTLNKRGIEDYSRDQAYLFSSAAEDDARLLNPMAMRCNSDLM